MLVVSHRVDYGIADSLMHADPGVVASIMGWQPVIDVMDGLGESRIGVFRRYRHQGDFFQRRGGMCE